MAELAAQWDQRLSMNKRLPDQVRLNLALAGERRFGSGTVYLCYRPA